MESDSSSSRKRRRLLPVIAEDHSKGIAAGSDDDDDGDSSFRLSSDMSDVVFPRERSQRVPGAAAVAPAVIERRSRPAAPRINPALPMRTDGSVWRMELEEVNAGQMNIGRCQICWEQQEHDDNMFDSVDSNTAERARKTALATNTRRFRTIIFSFERRLRGRVHDDIIFNGMIQLHHAFIGRLLKECNERYRPWTMDMLRRHFDPDGNHVPSDTIRIYTKKINNLNHLCKMIEKHGFFISATAADDGGDDDDDPSMSDRPKRSLFNLKAVETQLKVIKTTVGVVKMRAADMTRAAADEVETRNILSTLNNMTRRLSSESTLGEIEDAVSNATAAVVDRYDIGRAVAAVDDNELL